MLQPNSKLHKKKIKPALFKTNIPEYKATLILSYDPHSTISSYNVFFITAVL